MFTADFDVWDGPVPVIRYRFYGDFDYWDGLVPWLWDYLPATGSLVSRRLAGIF